MPLRLIFIAILLSACELWGAAVNGYVLNPLTETRLPDIEVAFYIRQEGDVSEVLRKNTDAEGNFSFAGPFLQDGLHFALAAFYEGVPYFSSTLEVGAQQQIILEVYENANDASALHITSHHLFLSLSEEAIECVQLLQVHNSSEHTYAGSGSGRERRVTEFALPPNLFNLRGQSGLIQQAGPGQFFDNQALPPGSSQLSISFNLNPRDLDDAYVHQAVYATERLEVFLDPPTLEISAPFIDQGVIELHDRQYRRFVLQELSPGQRVKIPLPLSSSLRWMLKWAALAGAFLVSGLALVLSRGRPDDASNADTPSLEDRQILLAEIARLDDAHAEQPQDQHYLDQRALLIVDAVALTRALGN